MGDIATEIPQISRLEGGKADIKIFCLVHGRPVHAVVDTGAQVTVISEEFYSKLDNPPDLTESRQLRAAAEDMLFDAKLIDSVNLKIGKMDISWPIYVAPIKNSMLLGIDLLRKIKARIDLGAQTLTIENEMFHIPPKADASQPKIRQIQLENERATLALPCGIYVPPEQEVVINISFPGIEECTQLLFEPFPDLPVLIPHCIFRNGLQLSLSLTNLSARGVRLKVGTKLGQLQPIDDNIIEEDHSEVIRNLTTADIGQLEMPEKLRKIWEDILASPEIEFTEAELERLRLILITYQDVFSADDLDLGDFTALEHHIDTGESEPVKVPMRRTPVHFVDLENDMLNKMLEAGVIQPSTSAWAAVPVLAKKRDGTRRWCLDYRMLNQCTKKDTFPVPIMSECLDALDGNRIFSRLDCNNAYWQVKVADDSIEKTAFRTRRGLYECRKMPFGLTNAPSTFCRVMNLVLAEMNWSSVLCFLDDICVLGKSVTDHLDNLEQVFSRLRKFKLKLKPRKCELFVREVEFLGRNISSQGVTLTDHSLTTIREWKAPTTRKEVEQFMGLANYHRQYIDQFADLSAPLSRLLQKGSFVWGDAQQQAFEKLKESLLSPAVLAIPNKTDVFILDTDASNTSVGAMLSQCQNGTERVVAYGSKVLSASQRRYCTTRRELLAVVTFVNHFRHYLLGRPFLVRTDHHSLIWLLNFKNLGSQLARWNETLSRFTFTIEHRPGSKHTAADALSRRPLNHPLCDNYQPGCVLAQLPCGGCDFCKRVQKNWGSFEETVDDMVELDSADCPVGIDVELPQLRSINLSRLVGMTSEEISDLQKKDPDLEMVMTWAATNQKPSIDVLKLSSRAAKFLWSSRNLLFLEDGVLFISLEGSDKLVVPREMKETVLKACHDLPSSGHQGREGTRSRLKASYYWYTLSQDVQSYVAGCLLCNKNKHTNRKGKYPMIVYQAGYPLEKVHMDFVGPLPQTPGGNKFVLVIVDNFTKWCELIPLPNQEAEITAKAAIQHFFSRFGCPLELVTDQGRNFEADLFKAVCDTLGIHKMRTTAYRPSANGQSERMNRTFYQILRCFVNEKQTNWDEILPLAAAAIRSSVNRQTGFTPNRLMLGREVVTPVDLMVPGKPATAKVPQDYVDALVADFQKAYEAARTTLKTKIKRMKKDYDLRAHVHSFKKGDAVLILNTVVKKGQSAKLKPVWQGPCVIDEVKTPYLYKVWINNRTPKVINHDSMKRFDGTDLPGWVTRRQATVRAGETAVYCICRKPHDHRLMIQCDGCLEWYHTDCVGITTTEARKFKEYYCPTCY